MNRVRRRNPIAIGFIMGGAFLAFSGVTSFVDPFAHRPLLDGLAPPPPYRWVDPPPELAAANVPPEPGEFRLDLEEDGNPPGVFSTNDLQASVVFPTGALPPMSGDRQVTVAVTPMPATAVGPAPGSLETKGNVIRIQATYHPSGTLVERFAAPAQLALVYPAEPNSLTTEYTMIGSTDGRRWTRLDTLTSPSEHRAGADIEGPGYFAVAGPPLAIGDSGQTLRLALVAGAVAAAGGLAFIQWRRTRPNARAAARARARAAARAAARKQRRSR